MSISFVNYHHGEFSDDDADFGAPNPVKLVKGAAGAVGNAAKGVGNAAKGVGQAAAGRVADVAHGLSGRGSGDAAAQIIEKEKALKAEVETLKQSVATLKSQHGTSSKAAEDLEAVKKNLESAKAANQILDKELKEKEAALAKEKADHETASKKIIAEKEAEIKKLQTAHGSASGEADKKLASLTSELEALKLKEEAERKTLAEKTAELAACSKESGETAAREARDLSEIEKLINEINGLVTELKSTAAL